MGERCQVSFPTTALNPDGKIVGLLVDADGKLVTDAADLPAETFPITSRSLRVDEDGQLELTE
jgi:hypothetical protein